MSLRLCCLLAAVLATATASAEVVYVVDGDPSVSAARSVYSWPSLTDFQNNTNRTTIGTTAVSFSSGISIADDGTFYLLDRSATANGTITVRSWASVVDYASGASGTAFGTTASLGQSSGFHIAPNGNVYFLEGDPKITTPSSRNLYSWTNLTDFATSVAGSLVGSTTLKAGLGISVGDSEIYFLEGSPENTGAKKILKWPTLADFLSGNNSTSYNNASTTTTAGLAIVVPEPSGVLMMVLAGAGILRLCRSRT